MSVPGHLHHFLLSTREEQDAVIRRLAAQGWQDHSIATFTGRAVEEVRRILAEPHLEKSEGDAC